MTEILLIAVAVGLGNFAASIGIGVGGVDRRTKLRVALIFGLFEATMPVVGLLVGRRFAGTVGSHASLVGGCLLVASGLYAFVQARRESEEASHGELPLRRLLLVAAALSIDNLVVGFALGTAHVSIPLAIVAIAVMSVVMSVVGLELGERLGTRVERYAGEIGAAVLIVLGITVLAGVT